MLDLTDHDRQFIKDVAIMFSATLIIYDNVRYRVPDSWRLEFEPARTEARAPHGAVVKESQVEMFSAPGEL